MKRHHRPLMLGALILVLSACGSSDSGTPSPSDPGAGGAGPNGTVPDGDGATPVDDRPLSPLTGLPLDTVDQGRAVLAVKVDNAPAARPQSGLDAADIVFEELVEFGITRFLALFLADLPDAVGPVRSGRPVDVDLLGGFGASAFAYSGARPEVLGLLGAAPSILVTEGAAGFFRDDRRSAPHNLYVDPASVRTLAESRGARSLIDIGWVFDPIPPAGALTCPPGLSACPDPGLGVVIAMSAGYRTGWSYDLVGGVYRRDQNGQPFDAVGDGTIGAANVVILATRHYVGASGYDETDATTSGAPAIVLRDGQRYEAVWVKPTPNDLLLLRTPDGRPFPMKPGPTWIHLPSADRMPSIG